MDGIETLELPSLDNTCGQCLLELSRHPINKLTVRHDLFKNIALHGLITTVSCLNILSADFVEIYELFMGSNALNSVKELSVSIRRKSNIDLYDMYVMMMDMINTDRLTKFDITSNKDVFKQTDIAGKTISCKFTHYVEVSIHWIGKKTEIFEPLMNVINKHIDEGYEEDTYEL